MTGLKSLLIIFSKYSMKEMIKIFLKIFFLILIFFSTQVKSKVLIAGNLDAKVVVKVFSSLTCPHCANFHIEIFNKLKKEYIDKGLVKFEHHSFPLDLAALNAELIVRCSPNDEKKLKLLGEIYNKQKDWAIGSDIDKINESIKKIGLNFNLKDNEMNKCLKDNDAQDIILEERIKAQKNYKIESTPTVFINDKKYTGKVDYEKFKKIIEKNL